MKYIKYKQTGQDDEALKPTMLNYNKMYNLCVLRHNFWEQEPYYNIYTVGN